MDFRELSYITTVADSKSVTAAAKKLYISQPSLSYIISKVEKDAGVRLFDRKTNPITLTYAGEKYVETARKILAMKENLRRELLDIGSGEQGEINIGIPTERAGYMLPKVASRFRDSFPRVEIRLQESKSGEIIDNLVKDRISIAVLPGGTEGLPVGMKAELIYRERLLLIAGETMLPEEAIAPAGREDRRERRVQLSMLGGFPFIMQRRGQYIRKAADLLLRRAGIEPKTAMEVSSCVSAAQLAKSGLGIAIVPERAVDALGGSERFSYFLIDDERAVWDVNAVYKESSYLDRAERYFIDLMKEVFGKTDRRAE